MDPNSSAVLAYLDGQEAKDERRLPGVRMPLWARRVDAAVESLEPDEDELLDLYEGWAWRFAPVPSVCAEQD